MDGGDGSQRLLLTISGEQQAYVGSDDGNLYAYDALGTGPTCSGSPKTCSPLWTANPAGGLALQVPGSPAVVHGIVHVGTSSFFNYGNVYAYDANSCGASCKRPPFCGDGIVQAGYEVCDHGDDNDDNAYDGCNTKCDWGPYCGDGVIDAAAGETCDDGLDNRAYSANGEGCGYDCQPAPYCGDGERNGPEQCDLGKDANTGEYGGCNEDCTLAPRCGDGVVQAPEECDDGVTGSQECTSSCKRRIVVK